VNNWKVIPTIVLATVLIFGAGVFTGGMLVDYVKQGHPRAGVKHPPAGPTNPVPPVTIAATTLANTNPAAARPLRPPEVLSKEFLQRLDTEIRLNKEQHEAVQKIIGDGQNEMRKVLQDARLEIREVLNPQQRDQFDELMKRPFHKPLFTTNAPPGVLTNPAPPAPTNAP
jgi:uncharacterized membrane protein